MLIRQKMFVAAGILVVSLVGTTLYFARTAYALRSDLLHLADSARVNTGRLHAMHQRLDNLRELFSAPVDPATPRASLTVAAQTVFAELNRLLDYWARQSEEALAQANAKGDLIGQNQSREEQRLITFVREEIAHLQQSVPTAITSGTALPEGIDALNEKLHEEINRIDQHTEQQLAQLETRAKAFGPSIWVGGFFSIAIVIGFAGAAIRLVADPLHTLARGMQRFGVGDFQAMPVSSEDEFGQLSEAINELAARLHTTTVFKTYVDRIFGAMVTTLVIVDHQDRVTFANASALRLFGYAAEDMVGLRFSQLLGTKDQPRALTRHLRERGALTEVELSYRKRDGQEVPMTFSGTLLPEDNSLICVAHDITARRQAEYELERIQGELRQASLQAGMAEVATGVLHNVGNVLNSLNVSATVVSERVLNGSHARLGEIVRLLTAPETSLAEVFASKRGPMIVGYLEKLHAQQTADRDEISREIVNLRKSIDHIREIVSMQQDHARVSGVVESAALIDIIQDALHLNSGALVRHQISLVKEFHVRPIVRLAKHKLLQILVNLIRNAKHACDEGGRPDKRIILRTELADGWLKIHVIDNGVGIPPENMARLFSHGFTTRRSGHGFGLHSGALAAADLKGSLTATSAGLGQGATFTLSLPASVL
jgi:PAS domain S-box-containing protein